MICQTINHMKYGEGVIQETRRNHFEFRIKFENTEQTRWIRADDQQLQIQPQQFLEKNTHDLPIMTTNLPISKSRKIIEALRVGLMPDDCVDDLTFGRDREIERIKQWLNSNDESTLLLVGNYGVGKTHLLNYTRSFALQNQYAVAFVEMDIDETPFHKPKRVYGQIVQNLRLRFSSNEGIENFRTLIKKTEHLLKEHFYFKHLFDIQVNDDKSELVLEWIEAKESATRPFDKSLKKLPPLYNFNVSANLYCNLLSALGWAIKQLRLKNLVLIFDESEILHLKTTATLKKQSFNFLNALLATAKDEPTMRQYPAQLNYDYATSTGNIAYLYQETSGLKILLAFTDDSGFNFSSELDDLSTRKLILEPLSFSSLQQILKEIKTLYEYAYNVSLPEAKVKHIYTHLNSKQHGHNLATRLWVKSYVEALDLIRFYPHETLTNLLQ